MRINDKGKRGCYVALCGWAVKADDSIVCFGAKPDKGFLDKKISPYPEVVRGRERELTTRPRRELVAGEQRGSWWLESREASSRRQLRLETTEGSWDWTRERRTERLAWIHGGAVNTRHRNREARRQDRVQWRRVSRCLIPVALWNFR